MLKFWSNDTNDETKREKARTQINKTQHVTDEDLRGIRDKKVDTNKDTGDSKKYKYPFENLVLAGGGAKGTAYCGVARALEEHGIMKNIKRFAGSSAGAITAALFAIGYNSLDVEEIMKVNMQDLLEDAALGKGIISLVANVYKYLGVHPADTFMEFLGCVFEIKTNNPDITFQEVYTQFDKELCIVVTNANTMSVEYCHMKTTPNMSIRFAVRMSMSFPVEFQPVSHTKFGENSLYLDGGLLCNYPIRCFDGWWLQKDEDEDFHNPEMYTKGPFECNGTNLKTLGCLVYAENQYHPHRSKIEEMCNVDTLENVTIKMPGTPLASKWKAMTQLKPEKITEFYQKVHGAKKHFIQLFRQEQPNQDFSIDSFKQILVKAYPTQDNGLNADKEKKMARECAEMLLGKELNPETIFEAVKKKDPKNVTKEELRNFAREASISVVRKYVFISHKREEFDGFKSFMYRMFNGLNTEVMNVSFKETDVDRTIGVNTWYIDTLDFTMDETDKQFLIDQGNRCAKHFLKNFADKQKLEEDTGNTPSANQQSTLTDDKKAIIQQYGRKKGFFSSFTQWVKKWIP